MAYDVERIRQDFPIFGRQINGHPMVYLDSANTAQAPRQVLDAMWEHHAWHHANVGRSLHTLGCEATDVYEEARSKVAAFVGARRAGEIVFTRNSTEAINLVAHSFGNPANADPRFALGPGDEILVSEMEHHSNLVPYQLLAQRTGATLRWLPLTDEGFLDLTGLDELLTPRTKLVGVVHVSNILGTVNPVARIVARAREVGALVLLDGSQSVPHIPVDVGALGVDFLAFTGHKMCGPTGIGALWAHAELLAAMPPFLGGGAMVDVVTMPMTTYAPPPARFEAGTPAIAAAVGLGAAVDYLATIGLDAIHRHEQVLLTRALTAMADVPGLRVYGPAQPAVRGGTISFNLAGLSPQDVGDVLDSMGVLVRVGRHCAAPVCARFGVEAMVRASIYLYSTEAEIDALLAGLHVARKKLARR